MIRVITKTGDILDYEADNASNNYDGMVTITRKTNPRAVSYTTGFWTQRTHSYIEYDYETVAEIAFKEVSRIEWI